MTFESTPDIPATLRAIDTCLEELGRLLTLSNLSRTWYPGPRAWVSVTVGAAVVIGTMVVGAGLSGFSEYPLSTVALWALAALLGLATIAIFMAFSKLPITYREAFLQAFRSYPPADEEAYEVMKSSLEAGTATPSSIENWMMTEHGELTLMRNALAAKLQP